MVAKGKRHRAYRSNRLGPRGLLLLHAGVDLPRTRGPDSHRDGCADVAVELLGCGQNKRLQGRKKEAIVWARGTVAFAGGPYLLISYVPYLSVLAIWFVASQSALFLGFATGTKIEIGTTWVNDTSGRVAWEDWDGNRWFATDFSGEYAFQSELLLANGEAIGINFVLACTAIQSMVLFIGAIGVLDLSWKKRIRALLLILSPTIHLLNLSFRNAGLIWMHMTYTEWSFWGLSGVRIWTSYIARFVSLFAMFLLALIMFEMLPTMHRNILALTGSQPKKRG